MSSRVASLLPLVVWTLVVWVSRLRNVWTDADLSASGQAWRTVVAAVFLGFALALAVRLWQRRGRELTAGDRALVGLFVAWTIGFWLVRGIGIIVDDHDAAFTAVHTALMLASIGLASNAGRALRTSPAPVSPPPVAAR